MRRSVSRIRRCELAQRGLEVLALALELLDVLERLLVLLLGERVDRAELLAAALQALDAGAQRARSASASGVLGRLGREAELARRARSSSASASCAWSRACCAADLAAGDLLAALLEPRVDARLLGGALAQLGGELLAGRAVGGELGLERLDAGRDRRAARSSSAAASRSATGASASSRASRRRSCSSRRARSARSRSARSASRCSVAIARLDLRAALRARALVGRGAALLDHPAGVALGLGGLVARARGGARLAVGRVARGVGLGDLGLRRLDLGQRRLLGLRGAPRPARPARRAGCAR